MQKFVPNEQQSDGLRKAKSWYKSQYKQCFEISGIAGSGKTTLVYHIIEELGLTLNDVVFVAYIGKASLALTMKGTPATTIHHLIYDVVDTIKTDEYGEPIKEPITGRPLTVTSFVKKKQLHPSIRLIVVDEGAMVNTKIAEDLMSFNIPMIILGDRNQLPPVMGSSMFLNNPDVILTEPMRQALDSPIIYLSQRAIKGQPIKIGKYSDKVYVISKDRLTDNMLVNSDVVICHKNSTREEINNHVRYNILKKTTQYPGVGEKIICRQNNWSTYISDNVCLINGLIGYVENVYLESYNKNSIKIDFRPEFLKDDMFKAIALDFKYICASYDDKLKMPRSYYNKFEYAYAITCHLAQGSEYSNVLVYNEDCWNRNLYKKWLYTAITRSSDSLILAL
jgi:exodeoxyribonuclease-5